MPSKKKDSPATVAALAFGIVIAVGFLIWNIQRSSQSSSSPPPAGGTTTAAQAQAGGEGGAAQEGTEAKEDLSLGEGEASLAIASDPFDALPAVAAALAPPTTSSAPAAAPATQRPPRPERVVKWPGGLPLPPFAVGDRGALPPLPARKEARPTEPSPELVGTLLGERPAAVFKAANRVAIVPVGGSLGAWKVVSVAHGVAVVEKAGVSRSLSVGGRKKAGVASAAAETQPAGTEEAQPEESTQVAAGDEPHPGPAEPVDDSPVPPTGDGPAHEPAPSALPPAAPTPVEPEYNGDGEVPTL